MSKGSPAFNPDNQFCTTYARMTDEELLRVSEDPTGISDIARAALLQELQKRTVEPVKATTDSGEWTSIAVARDRDSIHFPEQCPDCLRTDVSADVAFESLRHSHFRFIYTKYDYLKIRIPHCDRCSAHIARRRKIAGFYVVVAAIISFGASLYFGWNRLVGAALFIGASLPASISLRNSECVRVGEYDDETITFSFKSSVYAERFRDMNGLSDAEIAADRKARFLEAYNEVASAEKIR